MIGNKYHDLTITSIPTTRNGYKRVCAKCVCGVEKEFVLNDIVIGKTKSCGCLRKRNHFSITMESFMNKVYPEPNTGCWLWSGKVDKSGYGLSLATKMGLSRAHRISYCLHYGEFDTNFCVLHKCDVRTCVNPQHLFLGTRTDNIEDMVKKGRGAKGSKQGCAKLTESDVLQIRKLFIKNVTSYKEIGDKYNVSQYTIYDIIRKHTWNHI